MRAFKLVYPSHADGVDAVHVLSKDLMAVQYALTDPATRFAACTCPVATQHKACKHQVAWLLYKQLHVLVPCRWLPIHCCLKRKFCAVEQCRTSLLANLKASGHVLANPSAPQLMGLASKLCQ
jgi:hypothetical protein